MGDDMRVLVVNHSAKVWGAERQLLDLRPRLLDAGISVTLACPPGSDLERTWAATGSATIPYAPAGDLGLRAADGSRAGVGAIARQLVVTARDARRVAKLIRAVGADIVESYTLNANLEVLLAGRATRTPSVLDVHDIVVPGLGRRLLALQARVAALTIANSRATEATLGVRETTGRAGRIRMVHPGVDVDRFRPGPADPDVRARLAAHPDRPIVGILGRIDPEKGIELVARAVARLPDPHGDAQLVIVGASLVGGHEYEESVRAEVARLLGDRARFTGPTDDVPGVMRNLDVLVNASRAEPFGLTVLEAQACGVAVVAGAAGGIPEFVYDGENGLLFEPGDEIGLARALERMLGDAELRNRLAAKGLENAREKSIDRQATLVTDAYRSIGRSTGRSTDRSTGRSSGARMHARAPRRSPGAGKAASSS
jgi:glycosyltransferase involved in cell wall biosynthesis